jgi:hypothetical protein
MTKETLCYGCEGNPTRENSPCTVCGRRCKDPLTSNQDLLELLSEFESATMTACHDLATRGDRRLADDARRALVQAIERLQAVRPETGMSDWEREMRDRHPALSDNVDRLLRVRASEKASGECPECSSELYRVDAMFVGCKNPHCDYHAEAKPENGTGNYK